MSQNINSKDFDYSKENYRYLLNFDKFFRVFINHNLGITPAYYLAFLDWLLHLMVSPGKQLQLLGNSWFKFIELQQAFLTSLGTTDLLGLEQNFDDQRFRSDKWQNWPFNFYKAAFLLTERFSQEMFNNVAGTSNHHTNMNLFVLQQFLNAMSPANGIFTNPEVFAITQEQQGANLLQGLQNLQEDLYRKMFQLPAVGTEEFTVGKNLAITPGKVIYRNKLIELIQYLPVTQEVYKEPVLIVPACIMKYYILDLSSKNSLVKYLVSQGHTVFMISWKNPTAEDSELGFDDYLNLGVLAAIKVINNIMPGYLIHAAGYCLGGTMLAIAAAYLAGRSEHKLKTVTLLAAQIDFKLAGELLVFIDENQISLLQDIMLHQGYLDGQQMANAFNLLHSNDLIWGKIIKDYLMGERKPLFDVMAWNADTTRLPFKMHSEYLEKLFYNNAVINGEFKVNNQTISLLDLQVPIFAVGTVADHVAPWRSVYKINFFTKTDVTFLLTTGGHNVGIVSEPGHPGRSYKVLTKKVEDLCIDQDSWERIAPTKEGSWWLEWQQWLVNNSSEKIQAPKVGNNSKDYPLLDDAPGIYVLKK